MITTGIGFLSGVLLALLAPRTVDLFWFSFLPLCVFLAVATARWQMLWIILSGFLWASLNAWWQLDQRLPGELNNKRVTVVGEVVNIPRRLDHGSRFTMRIFSMENGEQFNGLVRLFWRNAPPGLAAGQRWSLRVKLKRPHGFQNPGGFDYERWLFTRGIGATGYVLRDSANRLMKDTSPGLTAVRAFINDSVQRHCTACDQGGLIQALSIGYRGDIKPHQRELLQQTGTAHLIAISGLHIGIIAGWFYFFGAWLWDKGLFQMRLNRRDFGLTLGWCMALFYSLLSGFDLPAQRAMLMLTVLVVAHWLRLPVNILGSVFVALMAVLIFSPLAVLSASFWLTFCALLVISLSLVLFRERGSALGRLVRIQLIFSLLFVPLGIVIFSEIHAASLIANLLAVPLVSLVVVPLNFLFQLLWWLPSEWLKILFGFENALLGLLLDFLRMLRDHGLAAIAMPEISIWRLLAIALFLLFLVLPRGFPVPRIWLLLPLALWPGHDGSAQLLHMAVLDVGMGTSVVIKTRHHSLVYDFGPGNERGYSLGQWVVEPYLGSLDIDHVDRVVISHADQDHLGGYLGIRDSLSHGSVFTGTPAEVRQKLPELGPVRDCHATSGWRWDGVDFQFVSADIHHGYSENNRSCVLKISVAGNEILIAGDIELRQEMRLLVTRKKLLDADILVAPHHGSMTSSSRPFIDAVSPELAIFTAGFLNRWHFPRQEILQRYRDAGVNLFRTDRDGAILVDCTSNGCTSKAYRDLKPRLWY